jgi:hypothetical protein
MRQITWQHDWTDGHWVDRADPVSRTGGHGSKLWKYGWGMLFIVAMTLLSEFGPRTVYSKLPPDPPAASQPAVHSVK